jgi:predicted alpha/beta hydrolase
MAVPSTARIGVLWLPALGVGARHYEAFATALAEQGVAIAVHEWRGAGSSDRRASRACDWGYDELLAEDIPASLAAAGEAHPDLRWIIAGHSLGGQLAALFAALNPQSIAGFAFVASGSPYWRAFRGRMRRILRIVPWMIALVTAICGYYPGKRLGFAGREARTLMRDWARTARTGRYQDTADGRDSEQALAGYAQPVLGIRLSEDTLCPEASFEWLLGKFQGAPLARELLAPGDFSSGLANHFSWLKDPQPVAERMAEWLRRFD